MSQARFGVRPTIIVLAIVATAFTCTSAEAQQKKGRFGGRFRGGFQTDMVNLANREQVRDELKMTDEQAEEIEKLVDAFNRDSRELRPDLEGLSEEEAGKKIAEATEKRQQLTADTEKKLVPILKDDQMKRLREIALQVQGPAGLLRADVADALKLNDEQKGKIKGIIDAEAQERRSAFGGGGRRGRKGDKADKGDNADKGEKGEKGAGDAGDRKAAIDRMVQRQAERRKQTEEEINKVLTEDQQKQLESLKGAKFELQIQQRRGRDQ